MNRHRPRDSEREGWRYWRRGSASESDRDQGELPTWLGVVLFCMYAGVCWMVLRMI